MKSEAAGRDEVDDDAAAMEFDRLLTLGGYAVPEDLRAGALAVHLELKKMSVLLHSTTLPAEAEPAHVFVVETDPQEA